MKIRKQRSGWNIGSYIKIICAFRVDNNHSYNLSSWSKRVRFLMSVSFLAVLFCTQKFNNPIDPNYKGDYSFTVAWDSLKTDTLDVFTKYTIPWHQTGKDAYIKMIATTSPAAVVDTGVFKNALTAAHDSFALYFTNAITGSINIIGERPNGKQDTLSHVVSVVNRYCITGNTTSAISDPVSLNIGRTDGNPLSHYIVSATWTIDGTLQNSDVPISTPFIVTSTIAAIKTITAVLKDSLGNTVTVPTFTVSFNGNKPVIQSAVAVDSFSLGKPATFDVAVDNKDGDALAFVIIAAQDTLTDSLAYHPYSATYRIASSRLLSLARDTGTISFTLVAISAKKLASMPYHVLLHVGYSVPVITFTDTTQIVPLNTPYTINVAGDAAKYRWHTGRGRPDTTTDSWHISLVNSDTVPDTIRVYGISAYGIVGKPDTMIVKAHLFNYTLDTLSIPHVAIARHLGIWVVQAKSDMGQIVSLTNAKYRWKIYPDSGNHKDTITDNKLKLYFSDTDTAASFKVSVFAIVNGTDTTNTLSWPVTVNLYRPICSFDSVSYVGKVNDSVAFSVKAKDSNSDGSIVAMYYRYRSTAFDTTIQVIPATKNWKTLFTHAGTGTVTAWAIDNDTITSDTASALLTITSVNPYFDKLEIDTNVFIRDSVTFSTSAQPGNPRDSIKNYFWDFDNNGVWDLTTTKGSAKYLFATAGQYTIRVGCKNGYGDTAIVPLRFVVTVHSGIPVVTQCAIDTLSVYKTGSQKWTYINKPAKLHVTAFDTNGVLQLLQIADSSVNGHHVANYTLTKINPLDTLRTLTFPAAGMYYLAAQVMDDDSLVSGYRYTDSLYVDPGIPVVNSVSPETTWLYSQITYVINATDNGTVSKWFMSLDGTTFTPDLGSNTFNTAFTDTGWKYVYVKVMDNDGNMSAVKKDSILVKSGHPLVKSVVLDTPDASVFIHDMRKLTITASDTIGTVKKVCVNWNGGSLAQDSALDSVKSVTENILHQFLASDAGSHTINVWAVDDRGLKSLVASKQIIVRLGKPVATPLFPDTVWYDAVTAYTVHGNDTNGIIKKWAISWDAAQPFTAQTDSTFSHSYTVSGTHSIRAFVGDDDSLSSDTVSKNVFVKVARPLVTKISLDTSKANVFVNDSRTDTVFAVPGHNAVDSVILFWNQGLRTAAVPSSGKSVFGHVFTTVDTGRQIVRAIAHDVDGFYSDTLRDTLTVRLGKPVITSMSVDTPLQYIYINDNRTFTINAMDTNGTVDSIKIDSGSGVFGSWQKVTGSSFTFTRKFARSDTGARILRCLIKDNDAIVSDTAKMSVTILSGAPLLSHAWCTRDTLWVRDSNVYFVKASDVNGSIRRIYAAWNGSSVAQDSISISGARSSADTFFTHAYDTTGGNKTARFWAMDDDSMLSAFHDTSFTIRKGSPVLWGDKADTLWTIINNGAGFYKIHINAFDTNGTIQKYFWNDKQGWQDSTNIDSSTYQFRTGDINNGYIFTMGVRDDDGLVSSKDFVVFADSAPPKPAILSVGGSGSPVTIAWSGKDAKDGDATLYQIWVSKGTTEAASSDSITSYSAGSTFTSGTAYSKDYRYDFTPSQGSGEYHYKVIAKDARGTISVSNDGSFYY